MGILKIVGGFFGLWVLFYLVVYLSYSSPDEAEVDVSVKGNGASGNQLKSDIADTPFAKNLDGIVENRALEVATEYVDYHETAISTNPFLSATCSYRTHQMREQLAAGGPDSLRTVGVVIPVRNEKKNEVLKTVESIIKNSGNELRKIIVVDDFSATPVDQWPEWAAYIAGANERIGADALQIKRLQHRNGVAKAKAFGAQQMIMDKMDVLVFVDAHVLVSKDWLIPLTSELSTRKESIVYPAIDVIDGSTGDMIKSSNAVGAFDWGLNFRWEIVNPEEMTRMKARLPLSAVDKDGHLISDDDVVSSPAAPGIFAINAKHYHDIGGFDTTLFPWGQENIEMSIRVWLCGGSVIRQPCSRVAHTYNHMFEDVVVNNGVTQEQVDKNVLSIAELWLSPPQRETVYQARFTNRVPYSVEKSLDSRQNSEFLTVKVMRDDKCQSFAWFIKEIYPGLELDREDVEIGYKNHLSSNYLETALGPILEQYDNAHESDIKVSAETVAALKRRETKKDETTFKIQKMKAIPPVVRELILTAAEKHADLIRETLVCMDEPKTRATDKYSPCELKLIKDPNVCQKQKSSMMFQCPQSCNLCGTDGKVCFDFYEKKCPEWKAEGQCESQEEELRTTCRRTCGFCTPLEGTNAVGVSKKKHWSLFTKDEPEEPPKLPEEAHDLIDLKKEEVIKTAEKEVVDKDVDAEKDAVENHNLLPQVGGEDVGHNNLPLIVSADEGKLSTEDAALALITTTFVVDPYTAQMQFKKGDLPDPPTDKIEACSLNDKSHGNLLAYMSLAKIDKDAKTPRVLCGIYTMEKNHEGNVQATRETWGKRCDGFIAFSTVQDDKIPSVNILHEGDEHYDNMWQKSRSIWKYIHAHFIDQFDYFLLGGDDMFYVVENLKSYLMSDEIVQYAARSNGIFLGRRFYPADKVVFNSGGAGYLLDRKALQIMGPALDNSECYPHQRGFWEDVNVAHCLKVAGGIEPYDTRDPEGRERFHPFTPGMHLDYRIPKKEGDWYPKYNPYLKTGYDCCAKESISFHYCAADLTKQLFNYLYHCDDKHVNDA